MWMLSGSMGASSLIFQVLLTRPLVTTPSVATSAPISDKPSPTVPSEMAPLPSAQFQTRHNRLRSICLSSVESLLSDNSDRQFSRIPFHPGACATWPAETRQSRHMTASSYDTMGG